MELILLTLAIMHSLFFLFLAHRWSRIPELHIKAVNPVNVSVIVPVRNERDNVINLLSSIEKQKYPKSHLEVVIINDHSSDNTADLIQTHNFEMEVVIKHLPDDKSGKKAAATLGVESANGEIVLCTDADCQMGVNWVSSYVDVFQRNELKMVSGPVCFQGTGVFQRMQMIEFGGLIAYGAVTLTDGVPGMCNGANMAYRKSTFLEVHGYVGNEHIPSGDDEFLLQKVFRKYPDGVRFLKNKEAIVTTSPKPDLKSFMNQRIRWISKWRFHQSNFVKLSAIVGFIDFAIACLLPFWIFLFPGLVLSVMSIRWLGEVFYLMNAGRFFGHKKRYWPVGVLMVGVYPYYSVVLGLTSLFARYSWKGRHY